jgi:hypothetical protein
MVTDVNRRRARAVALQFQAERAKADAAEARLRAHNLETSNQKLIEETARLSAEMLIDPLTGLFNRRHLDIVLRPDLSCRSADSPFSIALLDTRSATMCCDTSVPSCAASAGKANSRSVMAARNLRWYSRAPAWRKRGAPANGCARVSSVTRGAR